jgi:hypothetical protein
MAESEQARRELVRAHIHDRKEFLVTLADDFEAEVESLRQSQALQRFLDERSASSRRFPLEEIEAEIDRDLAMQREGESRDSAATSDGP